MELPVPQLGVPSMEPSCEINQVDISLRSELKWESLV